LLIQPRERRKLLYGETSVIYKRGVIQPFAPAKLIAAAKKHSEKLLARNQAHCRN
jgi:hypothetical protein